MDSQSVRTTRAGGVRGYDGGKRVQGRKRHLLVDTEGLMLAQDVSAVSGVTANWSGLLPHLRMLPSAAASGGARAAAS